jgi:hypothetical protein
MMSKYRKFKHNLVHSLTCAGGIPPDPPTLKIELASTMSFWPLVGLLVLQRKRLLTYIAPANATAAYKPLNVSVSTIREEYPNAKVMIGSCQLIKRCYYVLTTLAVGGWGDDIGYVTVSKTDTAIQQFAKDVNTMLTNNDADGVGK